MSKPKTILPHLPVQKCFLTSDQLTLLLMDFCANLPCTFNNFKIYQRGCPYHAPTAVSHVSAQQTEVYAKVTEIF